MNALGNLRCYLWGGQGRTRMAGRFRVDLDGNGHAEVSAAKARKLRPLGEEAQPSATGQPTSPVKSAMKKSALKKAVDMEPRRRTPEVELEPQLPQEPQPPPGPAPQKVKSAMKGTKAAPPPTPLVEDKPVQAVKSALKSSLKGSPSSGLTPQPPVESPPGVSKPKSALKARSLIPAPGPEAAASAQAPNAAPSPATSHPEAEQAVQMRPVQHRRPSILRMGSTQELTDWSLRGLCNHYYYYAVQKSLWDDHVAATTSKGRRSIKVSDFALGRMGSMEWVGGTETRGSERRSLPISPAVILDEEEHAAIATEVADAMPEISPLKELMIARKPDLQKLRKLLSELPDKAKWINASLDSTPPPMPAPLFHAVAAGQWDVLELLVEVKVDVTAQYPGKSMLKGWIKPDTPLVECVKGRKGRFVGTMLGDKLDSVEALLHKAAKAQRGEVAKPDAPPLARKRTKSIQLKCSRGLMLHTQGHPNMKYELDGNFCCASLSSVRAAIDTESGEAFAIKAGSKTHDTSVKDPEAELWNEIVILRKMEHPNIIKLYETFEDETHIFMVFELCRGGELFDRLVHEGCFPERIVMRVAYQMGSAIRHLHELRICHRDIRPEAFIVADDSPLEETCVKLIDFDTAKEIVGNQPIMTKICTLHYVAPEMLTSTTGYNEKIDIWSFGVVVFVMAAGVPPFDADNELDVLRAVTSGTFSFEPDAIWKDISQDVKDLLLQLMVADPEQRLDIVQVMDHPRMTQAEVDGAFYVPSKGEHHSGGGDTGQKNIRSAFAKLVDVLSDEQIVQLRIFFRTLDDEGSGMVELADCRLQLQQMVEGAEGADELIALLGSNSLRGKVNYAMFLATMTDKRRHIRREAARAVFNTFDIDKNGNVSLYEIAQAMQKESELKGVKYGTVPPKEVQAIWVEMKEVFAQQELSDVEMAFEDFFKLLPRANLDINV